MGQANSSAGGTPSPTPTPTRDRMRRARSSLAALLHTTRNSSHTVSATNTTTPTDTAAFSRSPSRLQRARHSLGAASLSGLLHRHRLSQLPPTLVPNSSSASLILQDVQVPDLGLNFDRMLHNATLAGPAYAPPPRSLLSPDPQRHDARPSSALPAPRRLRSMLPSPRSRRSSWADEDQLDGVEQLRRGEDQADVLSRILSLAAAATAASLVGEDNQPATRDDTFDTFLESLQNGSIASALRGTEGNQRVATADGPPAPLNFFRMFRFGTSSDTRNPARSESRGSASDMLGLESGGGSGRSGSGRMVPIIIVGIRSITPGIGPGQDDGNIPPFLDALSSFPTPPTSSGDTNDHAMRPPQNGTRFSHRRRASMGGFHFPAQYESQRHHMPHAQDPSQPWSSAADSPSSPLPPPPTPATSLGLSAATSGATTPASSTSPPSPTSQSAAPSWQENFARRTTGSALEPTVEEPPTPTRSARTRRLSESDFTRYGAGAPRRRGVVEPDDNPGEGSRSWIIYVLGGSYPENHPILATPSLFTDSPTYEDMMLLSSILGPAKPPVASEEDVASAPGLFRIQRVRGGLVAEAVDDGTSLSLAADARCLVCLCDFEVEEEARKLVRCEHLFHRICIDQWLTTGRNSCPLCRGEGVHESNKDGAEPAGVNGAPLFHPFA